MKNQSGVSLITLVITMVIAILLATIALNGGGSDVPDKAYFAGFAQEMEDLQLAVTSLEVEIKKDEVLRAHTVSEAQIYNYIARGGEMADPAITKDASGDNLWLSRTQAEQISCTPLNREFGVQKLGLKKRKVTTSEANDQLVSYFITPLGRVFCWPPYVMDNKSYVNATVVATQVNGQSFDGLDATIPGTVALITFGSLEERNLEKIYVSTVSEEPSLAKIVLGKTEIEPSSEASPAVFFVKNMVDRETGGTAMGYSFEPNVEWN